MKKRELEMKLQSMERFVPEHPALEQYETPADIAADILFFAYSLGDIENRVVCDLGCGSGIFALGSALLGAKKVIAVDVDDAALEIAKNNADMLRMSIDFIKSDVKAFNIPCDTVIQNPPFGSQSRHADRAFLDKAMKVSKVVYTMHLEKSIAFIEKYVRLKGGKITHELVYEFPIKHMFGFHRKEVERFRVKMLRIETGRR